MLLELENVACLKQASLELKGLSVVAGVSGSGKSTLCRALFQLHNALCFLSTGARAERRQLIYKLIKPERYDPRVRAEDSRSYAALQTLCQELCHWRFGRFDDEYDEEYVDPGSGIRSRAAHQDAAGTAGDSGLGSELSGAQATVPGSDLPPDPYSGAGYGSNYGGYGSYSGEEASLKEQLQTYFKRFREKLAGKEARRAVDEVLEECGEALIQALTMPPQKSLAGETARRFGEEFWDQILNIRDPQPACLRYVREREYPAGEVEFSFKSATDCEVQVKELPELNESEVALYLEPDIELDLYELGDHRFYEGCRYRNSLSRTIARELSLYNESEVAKRFRRHPNLQALCLSLMELAGGFISFSQDSSELWFSPTDKELPEAIHPTNLASGVKPFAILHLLVRLGLIRENALLIVDGFERGLTPWLQLQLGKVLVQLQQELDLRVLICAHTRYFLQGLTITAAKIQPPCQLDYYCAVKRPGGCQILPCDNPEPLFKVLLEPGQVPGAGTLQPPGSYGA
ncbi:MAG: hypothetical protein IJ228_03845 [Succinivibrio sp.]|nr:hypothetical protein [Succinivibrio sp.]